MRFGAEFAKLHYAQKVHFSNLKEFHIYALLCAVDCGFVFFLSYLKSSFASHIIKSIKCIRKPAPGAVRVNMLIALSSARTCAARILNISLMAMVKTCKIVFHHVSMQF